MSIEPKKIKSLVDEIRNEIGTGDDELILKRREQKLAQMVAGRSPSRTIKRAYLIAAAAVLVAAAAAFLWVNRTSVSKSDHLFLYTVQGAETMDGDSEWILASQNSHANIAFAQGTQFTVRDKGAVRILSHSRKLVHIELHAGRLDANVKGNGTTQWKISAGPFQLSVLGTQFSVKWNIQDSILHVTIDRGVVLVQGGSLSDYGVHLYAGHTLVADGRDGKYQVAIDSKEINVEQHIAEKNRSPQETSPLLNESNVDLKTTLTSQQSMGRGLSRNSSKAPSWLVHYNNDEFTLAMKAIQSAGLNRLLQTSSVEDLWRISQVYRNVGDSKTTNRVLLQIRKRFPASPKAKLAAFMLGRNMMEQQSNPQQAATWFERYIKESPKGTMIQEAYNRLMLSYKSSGQSERGKEAAERYLKKFPDGVYASRAKKTYHQ